MSWYFCLPLSTFHTNVSFTSSLKEKVSTSYIDTIIKCYKNCNPKKIYSYFFVHFILLHENDDTIRFFTYLSFWVSIYFPFSEKVIFKKFSLPEWWIIKRGFKYELCIHLQTKAPHYSACGIIITTRKLFGGLKQYIHKWDF